MSLREAIKIHTDEGFRIAEAYRKLAEDAINCRPATSFFLCAKCAKELS